MIWQYLVPNFGGPSRAFGCPVRVFTAGAWRDLVYQFQGGGQDCAVVHPPTGITVARCTDADVGYPEQRATAACLRRFSSVDPAAFAALIDGQHTLNTVPTVVGVLRRKDHVRTE